MKHLTIAALAAIALTPLAATAAPTDDFTIAVGQPDRGYEKRGKEIAAAIAQRGLTTTVVNYEGSDDISFAVCDGEADMGIMQLDALYARAKDGCKLQIVSKYGDEHAIVLFPPESKLSALSDMTSASRVLVDTAGSGTDLFWHTITEIEAEHGNGSKWAQAQPVNGFLFMADAMAAAGEIDAVIVVGNPNSLEVWELIGAGWDAGNLEDKDINDQLFNGKPLYSRERVKIDPPGMMNGDSEMAYVIPSFIAVNSDWAAANRRDFQTVVRAAK
jgi:TRAP-type uncharacterized transport system substrate-binding protein